tara:strand:- start:404 stop:625 length:222 start_codon:yes stop_codon:yes gene_type:complete
MSHQIISLKYPATRVVLTLSLFGYRVVRLSSEHDRRALFQQANHQVTSLLAGNTQPITERLRVGDSDTPPSGR